MNVERLRAVQAEEREADSLRPLPDAFYAEVAEYIEGLREERAAAADAAEDPFGADDVRRLTDEIETAEEVAEAIYERRVGKLVKRASLAAAGMPVDDGGLTAEEAALFSDLVAEIATHREEVFASFGSAGGRRSGEPPSATADAERDSGGAGHGDEPGASGAGDGETDAAGSLDAANEGASDDDAPAVTEGPAGDPDAVDPSSDSDESASGDDGHGSTEEGESVDPPGRVTLRITRDVGEVFGVDERVYDLAEEDVVTLPEPNAKPLLERDAAEQVD